jgi:hypothetical protein
LVYLAAVSLQGFEWLTKLRKEVVVVYLNVLSLWHDNAGTEENHKDLRG